jgi:LacI family transcriptional regulator
VTARRRTQIDLQTERGLPTIEEVAAAAKVSKTTVSHALSGNRPVAAATHARIERAIEELGYRPSALARSLKLARSHTVGLIVPDVTNPFYPALARGLQEAVGAHGYLALLADTGGEGTQERRFVDEAVDRRVDGLVLSTFDLLPNDLESAVRAGIAAVSIGPQLSGPGIDVVSADDKRAAGDAVEYLLERGHRRIATIAGPTATTLGAARLLGYRSRLAGAGVEPDPALVREADWTRDGGHAAAAELLALAEPPTAVFCANDLMAVGALDAAREAGVEVPGQLAVVGVDDIEAAGLVTPSLTTVRIPAHEVGRAGGELLLTRMQDPTRAREPVSVAVAHELIVRNSA